MLSSRRQQGPLFREIHIGRRQNSAPERGPVLLVAVQRSALFVLLMAREDDDQVDEPPYSIPAPGQQFQDAGADLAQVEPVHAEGPEKQGQQPRREKRFLTVNGLPLVQRRLGAIPLVHDHPFKAMTGTPAGPALRVLAENAAEHSAVWDRRLVMDASFPFQGSPYASYCSPHPNEPYSQPSRGQPFRVSGCMIMTPQSVPGFLAIKSQNHPSLCPCMLPARPPIVSANPTSTWHPRTLPPVVRCGRRYSSRLTQNRARQPAHALEGVQQAAGLPWRQVRQSRPQCYLTIAIRECISRLPTKARGAGEAQ